MAFHSSNVLFVLNMDTSQYYIDNLYTEDHAKCYEALVFVTNCVMGSNRQKGIAITNGMLPRLFQLLSDQSKTPEIRLQTVIILVSLTKGTEDQVRALVEADLVTHIFNALLTSNELKFKEWCIQGVFTVWQFPFADYSVVFSDVAIIRKLIGCINDSSTNSSCIMSILALSCRTAAHQDVLWNENIVPIMVNLLDIHQDAVIIATLKCVASLSRDNLTISSALNEIEYNGCTISDMLHLFREGGRPIDMQIAASKCITYIFRSSAILDTDQRVMFGALPTLVRLCRNNHKWEHRLEAAEILAFLIEDNKRLQYIASISNDLLLMLNEFVGCSAHPLAKKIKNAAYKVIAALGANDDGIRIRIIDTGNIVGHIMEDIKNVDVEIDVGKCLSILSRSNSYLLRKISRFEKPLWAK